MRIFSRQDGDRNFKKNANITRNVAALHIKRGVNFIFCARAFFGIINRVYFGINIIFGGHQKYYVGTLKCAGLTVNTERRFDILILQPCTTLKRAILGKSKILFTE